MEAISVNMKSLGRIAYEIYCHEIGQRLEWLEWPFIDRAAQDAWEMVASAVIDEHENRKPDPEDEEEKLI